MFPTPIASHPGTERRSCRMPGRPASDKELRLPDLDSSHPQDSSFSLRPLRTLRFNAFYRKGRKERKVKREDGYLLHSPSPYRLWSRVGFNSGVKDPSQGNGLDCQRLLHEAEEELAAAF